MCFRERTVVRKKTFLDPHHKCRTPFTTLGDVHGAEASRFLVSWSEVLAKGHCIQPFMQRRLDTLAQRAQAGQQAQTSRPVMVSFEPCAIPAAIEGTIE